jgi:hypothetical protein
MAIARQSADDSSTRNHACRALSSGIPDIASDPEALLGWMAGLLDVT